MTETLSVTGLRVVLQRSQADDIVDEVSFSVAPGEILGLVGESGSGKSTVSLALLGYCRRGAKMAGGSVVVDGSNMLELSGEEMRNTRGCRVAYVPQDPGSALNPVRRIGSQLKEMLVEHPAVDRGSGDRQQEVLAEVSLPSDHTFLSRYPHQLSGGQQQRLVIAMAFICRPRVIVMDEPTTGLDVTTQARVLTTVRELSVQHQVATVYVTHDLSVVANLAQRVAVMYAGRIVEEGPVGSVFDSASHPYTRALIEAIPEVAETTKLHGLASTGPSPGLRPEGCSFAPRCRFAIERCRVMVPDAITVDANHWARCFRAETIHTDYAPPLRTEADPTPRRDHQSKGLRVSGLSAWHGDADVLQEVSIFVPPSKCFALVGESGSGKTTLARCIAGLHHGFRGQIKLGAAEVSPGSRGRSLELRRRIQYVFQNPYASLNPRRTVDQAIAQPLRLLRDHPTGEIEGRVIRALDSVGLDEELIGAYPDELSGGQRQRVAIARALVVDPELLICDEVTSSLDVSVQAVVVELLSKLQREMGLSLLFVTHNLALVQAIAQEVAVMHEGKIVESGTVADVLRRPRRPYTRALLADTPTLAKARLSPPSDSTVSIAEK